VSFAELGDCHPLEWRRRADAWESGDAIDLNLDCAKPAVRQLGSRPRPLGRYWTVTGSIRLGSLFLTLPTRGLTGQAIMSSEG
jgi:hypothetical protein